MSTTSVARWCRVLFVVWGSALALIGGRTVMRLEYAAAVAEARVTAQDFRGAEPGRLATRRSLVAAGSLVAVQRQLVRLTGADTARLAREERPLIWRSWGKRYVSVPVKDEAEWDIVGAVVVEAQWLRDLWWVLLISSTAAALAYYFVSRALNRSATGGRSREHAVIVQLEGLCVLLAGAAVLYGMLRSHVEGTLALMPPGGMDSRFDPLGFVAPSMVLNGLLIAGVTLLVIAIVLGATVLRAPQYNAATRRASAAAWAFAAPSALHLLVFTGVPLVFTLYLSLHNWDLLASERPFVGLGNYREMLADSRFWNALRNTVVYALYVPVTMVLALGAAVTLNQPLRGLRWLRAIVFLPTIVSYVAIAIVWQWLLNADYGLVNNVLRSLGASGHDWLGDPRTALGALMVVSAWVHVGYQMIVYLAGLQGIPNSLMEAAQLDGAGAWRRFRAITWPLLRPISLYLFVTGVIWSFQVFSLVFVMTEGGPARSTDVLVFQIYQQAFEFRRMGYASALSWALFALLAVFTALQWRLLNKKESYVAA